MTSSLLIACGRQLFHEFDTVAPARDHDSDGDIGDATHKAEVSDHNDDEIGNVPIHDADSKHEVHAIDVDNNLNESDLTMEKCVQHILLRCRSGAESRIRYIIYNRRIWSASSDWIQQTYTGASAHTEHAHFSFSYDTAKEDSTASFHLEDIPVSMTIADKAWVQAKIDAGNDLVIAAVTDLVGDVVRRWDANGELIPTTDPNPSVRVSTALTQLGQTVARIEKEISK